VIRCLQPNCYRAHNFAFLSFLSRFLTRARGTVFVIVSFFPISLLRRCSRTCAVLAPSRRMMAKKGTCMLVHFFICLSLHLRLKARKPPNGFSSNSLFGSYLLTIQFSLKQTQRICETACISSVTNYLLQRKEIFLRSNRRRSDARVLYFFLNLTVKFKAIPLQAWTGPECSRKLRLLDFEDNRHLKVVRFSAQRTGPLYSLGNIPGTHFC
jgi:hypothetical protein